VQAGKPKGNKMITIENMQNANVNRVKKTIFEVRDDGLYCGQFSAIGYDASEERCKAAYFKATEDNLDD